MANKENDTTKTNGTVEPTGTDENKNGEAKKDETKKEFILIRGAKAIGRGCKKTYNAVNTFAHKHPWITAGAGTAVGYVVKIAVDHFSGDSDEPAAVEVPSLPEPEEETYVLDLPDDVEETEPEEEKANVE